MQTRSFSPEPFHPSPLLRNCHIQTLAGNTFRRMSGVNFRRERLDTPDGDFIDIDYADVDSCTWAALGDDSPIVLLLHGLEGSARRGYAYELYRQLASRGIRAVGMNYRSCSGEMNRKPYSYHGGKTEDVALVHDYLDNRFPDVAKAMVGVSLGANMLLKYLGECGDGLVGRLSGAAAISPPFNLALSTQKMTGGTGGLYARYFVRKMQRKVEAKAHLLNGKLDLERVRAARNFLEFDDACTAPINGFRDAADYYAYASCGQFIGGIAVPTLLLRSTDDPFFGDDIPHETIHNNPHLYPVITSLGGHVGFVEGALPGRYHFWAERQAALFLATVFG